MTPAELHPTPTRRRLAEAIADGQVADLGSYSTVRLTPAGEQWLARAGGAR